MPGWVETALSIALMAAILIVSYILTNWYARAMYNRCAGCGTLNAKRRTHCRACNESLNDKA